MDLNKLFNPQSIAIVGASEEEGKIGYVLVKNLTSLGYGGEVFLVNPKHEELLGRKCYKNLTEIEKEVDLAIVAVPAAAVNSVISAGEEKIKNYVVISAGFSEIGKEGKIKEEELRKITEEKNLNILGPNCLGFIIPALKLNASFAGGMPEVGNVALVSQSGALAVALMDGAKEVGLKFSGVFSIGNKMQIGENEMLEYLANDEKTKVVGLYLEGIKDGKRFVKIAGKISQKKPVVILKAGKTEKSQKAISSHTGALAGSKEIVSAVAEKLNLSEAENLEEFFNLLGIISQTGVPEKSEVVVVTNAGGPGVLTTDAFLGKSIKMAEISQETKDELKKFLPPESSVENPIDLLGDAREDRYAQALEVIKKQENVGAVIAVLTPQDQTPVEIIADKIIEFKKSSDKIVCVSFIGCDRVEKAEEKLCANGIFCADFPEKIVELLNKYYVWSEKAKSIQAKSSYLENTERKNKALEIIAEAKKTGRKALLFFEAAKIMDLYGIKTVPNWNPEGSGIAFPAVLKVDSDKVLHKTDKKGLVLNIQNAEELKSAVEELKNNFPGENLIVQPMLPRQLELILGIKKDSTFGPIAVFGLGGIYTEIFKAVDFVIPPASEEEIKEKILSGKIGKIFSGARGQKSYNSDELAKIISGVLSLAQELPEIVELDINPLLVYNDGKEAVAVDVKIMI